MRGGVRALHSEGVVWRGTRYGRRRALPSAHCWAAHARYVPWPGLPGVARVVVHSGAGQRGCE